MCYVPLRRRLINIILAIFLTTQLSGCGGSGCEYPDETAEGGIWEVTQVSTVRPINRGVIAQENQFGSYTLSKGVTETRAKENLWTPMRTTSGDDAIVEAGNKMKINVSDSIILSGYQQTINVTLDNWIPFGSSFVTIPDGQYKDISFSDRSPSVIVAKQIYEQNGRMALSYIYTVKDDNGADHSIAYPTASGSSEYVVPNSSCKPSLLTGSESINYGFLIPEKIIFDKFPVSDAWTDNIKDIKVVVNVDDNNLTCSIKQTDVLWYVCSFDYDGKKYEYRRRVTPLYDGKYPAFEEQVNSLDNDIEYEDTGDTEPVSCDGLKGEELIKCYEKISEAISSGVGGTKIKKSSKPLHYLMCIRGGDDSGYKADTCSNFYSDGSEDKDDSEDKKIQYNHIVYSNGKSPIRVYFKSFDQVYGSGYNRKTYSYNNCFQNPIEFYIGDDKGDDYSKYKNRFLSSINSITCSDGKTINIQSNCRIVPSRVKYRLHNIKIGTIDWMTGEGTDKEKQFCSRDCIDLCTTYFKVFDCPGCTCGGQPCNDSASHFYRYVPVNNSRTGSFPQTDIVACSCTNMNHTFEAIGRNNENLRAKIASICRKNDGWHGLYASAVTDENDSNIINYNLSENIDKFTMVKLLKYYDTNFTMYNVPNKATKKYPHGSDSSGRTGDIYISYNICSPYAKVMGYCTEDNLYNSVSYDETASSCIYTPMPLYDDAGKQTTIIPTAEQDTIFTVKGQDTSGTAYNKCMTTTYEEQCKDGMSICSSMGYFFYDGNLDFKNNERCPKDCQIINYVDTDPSGSTGVDVEVENPNTVSWIDYSNSARQKAYARKGAEYNDANNTLYYALNDDESDIYTDDNYVALEKGLLPIAGNEIVEIECTDDVIPDIDKFENISSFSQAPDLSSIKDKLSDEQLAELEKYFIDSNCRANGSYREYITSGEVRFVENKNGIIPIQWSKASIKTGKPVPITVTTTYPIKVKSINCVDETKSDCYIELNGGNGLVMYIMPNEDDNSGGGDYSDPDMWQCNTGPSGSYGIYRPYLYKSIADDMNNRRKIDTNSKLWWNCDNETPMWFSGYDFLNTKTGQPINFHIYNVNKLKFFMPNFEKPDEDEGSVAKVGCNADGLPTTMTIGENVIKHSQMSGIVYDEFSGASYKYTLNGETKIIGIYDTTITNKTYEKYMPKVIVVDLEDIGLKGVTISNDKNNLTRVCTDSECSDGKRYYSFTYETKKYKIEIESDKVQFASCYAENEEPEGEGTIEPGAGEYSVLTDIKLSDNTKYYSYNGENQQIFTRYGPFTGFAENQTGILLPAIYQTQHVCRSSSEFIYDEQPSDKNKDIRLFMGYPDTNTPRKNLDKAWRIEFSSPDLEETITNDNDPMTGTNARCVNKTSISMCGTEDEPDVMIVDLSKTEQAVSDKSITGTVFLYKVDNLLDLDSKNYYSVSCSELGWVNKKLYYDDDSIQFLCDGIQNCTSSEIPVIVLTVDGKSYKLSNSTDDDPTITLATISTRQTLRLYSFEYDNKAYTISADNISLRDTICYTGDLVCKTYLQSSISNATNMRKSSDRSTTTVYSLGRFPYMLSCGGKNEQPYYRFPYSFQDKNESELNDTDLYSDVKNKYKVSDSSVDDAGIIMQSGIASFITNSKFARCVPSWLTPSWMILKQPNDPSSFNTGFSAISGTYIAPYGASWSKEEIKDKYKMTSVWQKYGGIINNSIMEQTCETKSSNIGSRVPVYCKPKNVSSFSPEFKTVYDKQFIFVKSLVNDVINTSDDECRIYADKSKLYSALLKMNDPFGTLFPSKVIESIGLDKNVGNSTKSGGGGDTSKVQEGVTVNGDGSHRAEFFKKSELYRNFVGAGILHPEWHIVQDADGKAKIFNYGEDISFSTSGNYYSAGNLSHKTQAYCAIKGTASQIGRDALFDTTIVLASGATITIAYGIKTISAGIAECAMPFVGIFCFITIGAGIATVTAGLATLFGVCPGLVYAALAVSNNANGGAETKGKMTSLSRPLYAKKDCGVATAFRVVPVPPFACLSGYELKCSNDRINKFVDTLPKADRENELLRKCVSEEQTVFQTQPIPIGRCYKRQYDIVSGETSGNEETMRYRDLSYKYLNTLIPITTESVVWSANENVYESQCGLCVKSNSIYSYNGVSFTTEAVSEMPKTIRTSEHCLRYKDNEGASYRWVTNIAKLTHFDNYTVKVQNDIKNNVVDRFVEKLRDCDQSSSYTPDPSSSISTEKIRSAFMKEGVRDRASCVSSLISLYTLYVSDSETTSECATIINNSSETIANAVCAEMRSKIEATDGTEYSRYMFKQNGTSGVCGDDKNVRKTSDKSGLYSLTRIDNEDIVSKYGYGELTDGNIYSSTDPVSFTVTLPNKIRGKTYNTARIGFAFAGVDNTDLKQLYKDYRVKNSDDLKRGYLVTIGNGMLVSKGKYLYYYIQPLNDAGRPDPNYEPNTIFSPSKTNLTTQEIIDSPMVYSFKEADADDNGSAMITTNRTGKIWFAVLDPPNSLDGDTDGQVIEFVNDNTDGLQQTTDSNYLSSNSGYYQVSAKIQTENDDLISDMLKTTGNEDDGYSAHTLFSKFIIKPIKTIFMGEYKCKRCLIKDPTKCEEKTAEYSDLSDSNFYNADGYKQKCDYLWESGIIGQLAMTILKTHLIYIFWFIFTVVVTFYYGFQFLMGMQSEKFDFKFMKKYLWQYALIMAFVNPYSWSLYLQLFVKPAFSLAEGLSAYVASNFSSSTYNDLSPSGFITAVFGPVDDIFRFWINTTTVKKIIAILFSSWTGWIAVVLLLICFVFFVISVLEACALYVVILIKMSLYLSIGPIVFLMLIHSKTAGKFTEWWKSIAGLIAEQVTMFTAIAVFSTIYYHILKGSMNFIYCWEPVLKIPILDITLFSAWRIAGSLPAHMAELMGSSGDLSSTNNSGFNVITGLVLFIITCLMSKFVNKASTFGAKLFGQSSSMPEEIKKVMGAIKGAVKDAGKTAATAPYKYGAGKIAGKMKDIVKAKRSGV